MSASNPHLRERHEVIIIASKGRFDRGYRGQSDISRDEFLHWTQSVWCFSAENNRKNPHPAPFPFELPFRLIKLYSYVGDLVLDPFAGSGTTLLAAHQLHRRWLGIELRFEFIKMARKRLESAIKYRQLELVF